MIEDLIWIGRDLYASGAISTHGGNLSERLGDTRMLITRTGSMLGRLTPDDIIETSVADVGDPRDAECSVELVVHRAIYAGTDARAIVHAHSIHTLARAFLDDVIVPVDSESLLRLVDVPVVTAATVVGSSEAAAELASALRDRRVAVLRTHGPFAKGTDLEDALQAISCLEASCEVLNLLDMMGRGGAGKAGGPSGK